MRAFLLKVSRSTTKYAGQQPIQSYMIIKKKKKTTLCLRRNGGAFKLGGNLISGRNGLGISLLSMKLSMEGLKLLRVGRAMSLEVPPLSKKEMSTQEKADFAMESYILRFCEYRAKVAKHFPN